MPYKIANPRGVPAGETIVSQKQADDSFTHYAEGDTVKKADFPEDGWQWLLDNGLVVSTGRSTDG